MSNFPVFGVFHQHEYFVDTAVLDTLCFRFGNLRAFLYDDFARFGVDNRIRNDAPFQTIGKAKFLVVFVSTHFRDVVAAGIEEQIVKVLSYGVFRRQFTGTKTSIQLYQAFRFASCGVLCKGACNNSVVREQVFNRAVRAVAERAQKSRDTQLLLSIHAHVQRVLRVLF